MYYMSTVEVAPDTSWTSYRPSTSTENVDIHNEFEITSEEYIYLLCIFMSISLFLWTFKKQV